MKSLDTNILLYGTNEDAAEHAWARPVIEMMLAEPRDWILAEQVLIEYYRLVRNSAVLERPLSASEAADRVAFFRDRAGCLHCGYDSGLWPRLIEILGESDFPARRTFDAVLALTLQANSVQQFYTRNDKDFRGFDFFEVVNPEQDPH